MIQIDLPEDLAGLILCFDGRCYHAFLRDYIEGVYVSCYQRLSRKFTFKHALCKTKNLLYYACLASALRGVSPTFVKDRRCVRHQNQYGEIQKYHLVPSFKRMFQHHLAAKVRLFGSFINDTLP